MDHKRTDGYRMTSTRLKQKKAVQAEGPVWGRDTPLNVLSSERKAACNFTS